MQPRREAGVAFSLSNGIVALNLPYRMGVAFSLPYGRMGENFLLSRAGPYLRPHGGGPSHLTCPNEGGCCRRHLSGETETGGRSDFEMLTRQAIAALPPRSRFDLGRMPQTQETESLESLAYGIICREEGRKCRWRQFQCSSALSSA